MNHLIDELRQVGFSKKEAAIYLAALQLGRVNASSLSKRTGIARATTYAVLKELEEKGLMTVSIKKKEHVYQATHPNQVERLLKVQRSDIESRIEAAERMKTKLLALYNEDEQKLKIRYFEGIAGMQRLRDELSVFEGEILQIVGYDAFMMLQDPQKTKEYREGKLPRKARPRSIVVTDKKIDVEGFDVICVPSGIVPVEGEMTVLEDRLIMFSYAEDIMAIEVTSRPIADTARALLEFAWRFLDQKKTPSDKDQKGEEQNRLRVSDSRARDERKEEPRMSDSPPF